MSYYRTTLKGKDRYETITITGKMAGSASQTTGRTNGNASGSITIPTIGYLYADITLTWSGQANNRTASSSVGIGNNRNISEVETITLSWAGSCSQTNDNNYGSMNVSGSYSVTLHN